MSVICIVGVLEVLHSVLLESPEAVNVMKEEHIKSIVSFLDRHGHNHKVINTKNCLQSAVTELSLFNDA